MLDDFAGASRGLGVVNQHNTLWDDLSCLDHLLFFAALRTKVGHERIALTTLAQLELSHHAHKMAGRLSGAVWESNCRVASPARWRGVVVYSARFSHVHPTHWLISTQVGGHEAQAVLCRRAGGGSARRFT